MLNFINGPGVLAVTVAECGSFAHGVGGQLHDAGTYGGVGHACLREHECAQSFARRSAGPVGSLGFDNVCAVDTARLDGEHERLGLRSLEVHVVVRLRGGVEEVLARRCEFQAIGRRYAVQVFACHLEGHEVGICNGVGFSGNTVEEVAVGAVGIVEGVSLARNNIGGRQFAAVLETNSRVALLGITTKPRCKAKQEG